MASTYHADIQALYVAYFNRPADFLGLDFWEKAIESAVAAAGTDPAKQAAAKASILATIADDFATQDEYLDVFEGMDTEQVIGQVYQNLFGHAPDLDGLVFWVNAVRAGHVTIGNAVTSIAAGAQGTDKEAYENKVAAAVAFTNEFDTGEEVLAYKGEEALTAAKSFIASITTDATLEAALADIENQVAIVVEAGTPDPVVVPHTLTTGLNTVNGGAADDVINGTIGAGATLTALDTINGGAGSNTLNIADLTGGSALPAGLTVTDVQTINLSSAAAANIDVTTGFAGLTQLNVLQSTSANVDVAGATAVNVFTTGTADVTAEDGAVAVTAGGMVTAAGGSTQTVTTKGGVALSGATGAITVTDTAQGGANTTIDNGTSVTLSTKYTAAGAAANMVTIGATAGEEPTGAVSVTATVAGTQGASTVAGDITVNGGSTVSVTSVATQAKATAAAGTGTLTQSAIDVNGTADTTSVTVKQTAEVAAVATVAAVTGKTETASITFTALAIGESVTVDGLTFTATAATTAAQTAAAFANIAAGATHGASTRGVYSGANAGNFTSGAASGTGSTTVVFTSTTAETAVADIVVSDTVATTAGLDQTVVTTAGVTAVAAKGTGGIAAGVVTVVDSGDDTIATVSLDAYGSGSAITSDALNKLTLANAKDKALTVTNTVATTMDLTLNAVTGTSSVALGGKYASLAIHSTGASNNVDITAAGVTALTIDGDKAIDLAGAAFGALKTVTVSGAAGVTMDASGATVTSFNASASSGANTVSVDATKATVAGGSGVDTVTVIGGVSKNIALGAGADKLILAAGTTAVTGVVTGGADSDTLSIVAADAATADDNATFASKVSGFEVLELRGATGAQTVDIATLGGFNSVTTGGAAAAAALTLAGFSTGGTLTINAAQGAGADVIVTGDGFEDGTADVFNVVVSNAAPINAGTVVADSIETINITSTDTDGKAIGQNVLAVEGDSVKTITLNGNAGVTLTSANTTVTTVNGSAMTGSLVYTTLAANAQTVTGGAGADVLTAAAGTVGHTLNGGAGADKLVANAGMSMLTGGAGADTFVIETASQNVNSYSTITDAAAGDKIDLMAVGALSFGASKLTLGATAVFQDYANAAVNGAAIGGIVWFQFGGDTYIVQDAGATNSASFINGEDIVVKLTGLVDLSTTTLNADGILLIGNPAA